MDHEERKLSDYIDRLNAEQRPDEHQASTNSPELEDLYHTVRMVRSLKEPTMPGADFQKRLIHNEASRLPRLPRQSSVKRRKRFWLTSVASIAVILFITMMVTYISPFGNPNVVHAMEAAFQEVKAYHGVIEVVETNANGEATTQAKLEVWANKDGHYYMKGLEGSQKDLITVNNGQQKWQIRPDQKQVHLFPAFPDAYRFTFELGSEINKVTSAVSTRLIGDDTVIGRHASILEVTPQGGEAYRIWIDKETKLPLQKQYAMHNAIQYTITYTQIDFSDAIPNELTTYHVPNQFEEINTNPEQIVTDLLEAENAVGFTPKEIGAIPAGYVQDRIAVIPSGKLIKIYYTSPDHTAQIIVVQGKSTGELKPAGNAILGTMNNQIAEIQSPIVEDSGVLGGGGVYAGVTDLSSIRFQQDGFEYAVVGNTALDPLISFTESLADGTLEISSKDEEIPAGPQVEVPVNLEIEKSEQKNADAGSSPWKLDPVFVTQVFVSLQISPEGITGEYPILSEDLKVIQNNGKEAIIAVSGNQTPIEKVYLKRVIREDSTGIWTVIGYDPLNRK